MSKRTVGFALLVLLGMTTAASAQTEPADNDIEIRLETPVVVRAARRGGGSPDSCFLRNYLLYHSVVPRDDIHLKSLDAGFCSMERYELLSTELVFQGLGMGASLGLCAGALGSSFGWWDDEKAWLMMGAMSAVGAIWTATKADDPAWRYRYRLREDP